MEEYEYSFKVTDLNPYIEYCKKNNYDKREETSQTRILYKNINRTIARITTQEKNGNKKTVLDFKDDNESDSTLKVCRESLPLEVLESNREAVDSILDMLGYKIKKTLIRNRIVYFKDEVVFELDNYSSPETMYVVGIEGNKEKVDKVYNEVKKIINNIINLNDE